MVYEVDMPFSRQFKSKKTAKKVAQARANNLKKSVAFFKIGVRGGIGKTITIKPKKKR